MKLQRLKIYRNVDVILDRLYRCTKKRYTLDCKVDVKTNSQRYDVFRNSTTCVKCGLKGTFLAVERSRDDIPYHLNLYGINKKGKEVLFTKDHILPKSRGGKNHISNYQTMCHDCNFAKGNSLEDVTISE